MNEPIHYEAGFLLDHSYPELNQAKVIVTNIDGKVTVGVKAVYREYTRSAEGYLGITPRLVGDYCVVDQNITVAEFFGSLKEMLNRVPGMIEDAKNGDKSKDIT